MVRKIRIVIPDVHHHIVQRGSRRDYLFFSDRDRVVYKELLAHYCKRFGVRISAYCLMLNHIHLIAIPDDETSLSKAIGIAHNRYSTYMNQKMHWRGHLWEGRFYSNPMSENHILQAAKYIERNPVTAKMVDNPWDYHWSSCRHHLGLNEDFLIHPDNDLLDRVDNWKRYVSIPCKKEVAQEIELYVKRGFIAGNLLT